METVQTNWATHFISWCPQGDDFSHLPSYVAFLFQLVSIISHVPDLHSCKGHCSIFLLILLGECYWVHLSINFSSARIFFPSLNYAVVSCCQSKLNYRKPLSWVNLPVDQKWEPSKNNRPAYQLSRGERAKCLRQRLQVLLWRRLIESHGCLEHFWKYHSPHKTDLKKGSDRHAAEGNNLCWFCYNICFAVSHALTVTAWAYTITLITYWWAYFLWQCPHLFLKPFIILSSTTFWFLEPWFNYFFCESFCFVLKVICLHDASSLVVKVLAIIHFNDALLQPSLTVFSQLKSPTLHNFSSAGG